MRANPFVRTLTLALVLGLGMAQGIRAAGLQLVSTRDLSAPASVTGGGLSTKPVIDGSGRFVAFASTARNLTDAANAPVSSAYVPRFNVFLRDRLNGTTTLVSENTAHQGGGDGDSFPCGVSSNGDRLVFVSDAANLVNGDTNGVGDVFVRDLSTGLTTLVSLGTNGAPGNGESYGPLMTPDGRYVFFSSAATNLVAGDTNRIVDVFVRDLIAGTTTLVSANAKDRNISFAPCYSEIQSITPDGRWVAYVSTATNQAPPGSIVSTNAEIYIRDLVSNTTAWVSTSIRTFFPSNSLLSNAISGNAVLTPDGRHISFATLLTNSFSLTNAPAAIFWQDLQTGAVNLLHTNSFLSVLPSSTVANLDMTPDGRYVVFVAKTNSSTGKYLYLWDALTTNLTLINGSVGGFVAAGSSTSWPSIDATGQYVTFISTANNLVTNLFGEYRLYVRDLLTGKTTFAALTTNQAGIVLTANTPLTHISDDASVIVFESDQDNIVANDRNSSPDIFAANLASQTVELISTASPLRLSQTAAGLNKLNYGGISADGRFVAFLSTANDLDLTDTNGTIDAYVHDMLTGTNIPVCVGGTNDPVWDAVISSNGNLVAFSSPAKNLGPWTDSNSARDVFVRNLTNGQFTLVSQKAGSFATGNGPSYSPAISDSGRYVTFFGTASDLASGGSLTGSCFFLRDLQISNTWMLTSGADLNAVMTHDGSRVLFAGNYGSTSNRLFVWDTATTNRIYTNSTTSFLVPAGISDDGTKIAYLSNGTNLVVTDLTLNTNRTLASGTLRLPRVRRAGRWFTYLVFAGGPYQVWLYDFTTGTNLQITGKLASAQAPYYLNIPPEISSDGRYLAHANPTSSYNYSDLNGASDVVLYDRLNDSSVTLSLNAAGGTANGKSWQPYFSGDGKTLFFTSLASDLKDHDSNENFDIFAFHLTAASWTDADGDGMSDAWESQYWGNTNQLAGDDFDGDGLSNLMECRLDTNPTNADPRLTAAITLSSGSNQPAVTWPTLPHGVYQVQFKDDLNVAWQTVTNTIYLFGTNGMIYDAAVTNRPQRYYRILLN